MQSQWPEWVDSSRRYAASDTVCHSLGHGMHIARAASTLLAGSSNSSSSVRLRITGMRLWIVYIKVFARDTRR